MHQDVIDPIPFEPGDQRVVAVGSLPAAYAELLDVSAAGDVVVRISAQAKPGAAGRRAAPSAVLLAAVLVAAGCSTTVEGRPVAAPGAGATEPASPSTRPPKPAPPAPTAPADAIPLPANEDGYVFIETKSGQTRCEISAESVGCEADFTNSPMTEGQHANGVSITSDGEVQWVLGNLGAIPAATIDYLTYDAQGWTITATVDGTRFTNNRTGHGMFVSIDNVETF